uniref:Uncharacterized protein n=1 Tax=Strigamia maritima TaxID=126957 RepID=T1IYQ0_STRMM
MATNLAPIYSVLSRRSYECYIYLSVVASSFLLQFMCACVCVGGWIVQPEIFKPTVQPSLLSPEEPALPSPD